MDGRRGIGWRGSLPWHLPEDLEHFRRSTWGATVLMGSSTYRSLPPQVRPLRGRKNVVASRSSESFDSDSIGVTPDAVGFVSEWKARRKDDLWIIGGAQIYAATLPLCDEVLLTLIPGDHPADTFMPAFEQLFTLWSADESPSARSLRYGRGIVSAS